MKNYWIERSRPIYRFKGTFQEADKHHKGRIYSREVFEDSIKRLEEDVPEMEIPIPEMPDFDPSDIPEAEIKLPPFIIPAFDIKELHEEPLDQRSQS
jgi:hypothetical protein